MRGVAEMCGLAGWQRDVATREVGVAAEQMAATLSHRGPDADGCWTSDDGLVSLAFRRLAIRDLDPRANQPMTSASGRSTIVFNGEIYNTEELVARHLPGVTLKTTGDTEVLLEALEKGGTGILSDVNGMFALAFHDNERGIVHLARDGAGKKPLFVYHGEGLTGFASELRAFGGWRRDLDPDVVPEFLHLGYVPAPRTFFKQVTQLRPGELVSLKDGRINSRHRFVDCLAWDWGQWSSVDSLELSDLIGDAVSRRTTSDVPLGTFLSGGVDSSLVAASLAAGGQGQLPVFTVSFDEASHDESLHAEAIAAHLGLTHHVIPVRTSTLPGLLGDFLDCYEQPYADTSGLPTMLLCQAVREHVTVALCGDGGDEFFGGYARYEWFRRALSAQRWPRLIRMVGGSLLRRVDQRRGARMARWLEAGDAAGLYAEIMRGWHATAISEIVPEIPGADERPVTLFRDVFARVDADPLSQAAAFDAAYYIPDDLQVKVDRASMRHGLEVRCPLLDHRIRQFGASLTTRVKMRSGSKSLLKDQLSRHVPRQLFERPKMGFGVPLASWMRGPLGERFQDSLGARAFRECGWLDQSTVARVADGLAQGRPGCAGAAFKLMVLSETLQRQAGGGSCRWQPAGPHGDSERRAA